MPGTRFALGETAILFFSPVEADVLVDGPLECGVRSMAAP